MTLPHRPSVGSGHRPGRSFGRALQTVTATAVAVTLTAGLAYAQGTDTQATGSQDTAAHHTAAQETGPREVDALETAPAEADDDATDLAPADKVEPELQQQLTAQSSTDFWVRFEESADLSPAHRIDDWDERGAYVADALRATAEQSQSGIRARLDSEDVNYQTFWATNAIYVHDGSAELADSLATHQEVDALYPTMDYDVPELEEDDTVRTLSSVEWGIAAIRATDVWDQYDIRGDGVVVASIDTGAQFDHPALVDQYRGNLGDGTFNHDYNWFDAYGYCDGAPCDSGEHGTHTMGTIAGDDGAENKIGVAPDVTWITANGCCSTNAGLIASGQWMLEPTDVNGDNPDAAKRPHIVNNSWGTEFPSVDPFMEDVMQAWTASGIMGVWANGNEGPACRSSSSPGSRIINYSVGAYDIDHQIADLSGRGAGQDGEIKPNITAPGVNVRSAVPNDSYRAAKGTSMATPHVAGAVALLWSAAPGLVGDLDSTRELLDGTAVDTPDDQCGGTDDDNNVFGEGRLDTLSMLDAAPVGGTGTLAAAVTDAESGEAVPSARITVDGPVNRERVTGDDGTYSMPLPPGDYEVSVSAYGYAELSTDLTINADESVDQEFALEALSATTVEGRIVDGSGQGWPIYAQVSVDGMPGDAIFTDPVDGRFSLSIPVGEPQVLTVDPHYDGYQEVTEEVTVTEDDPTLEIEVPVAAEQCAAPGYDYAYDGLTEDFDDGQPDGWEVVDNIGTGHVWQFDDPYDDGNHTGGEGGFAIAQSPGGGDEGATDTSLLTPVVDLTDDPSPILQFRQDFQEIFEIAHVDLSLDGGDSWETVLEQSDDVDSAREIIPLPQAGGESDVRVRFRLLEGTFKGRWWQVDDVFLGTRSCEPVPGSLVTGHVYDRNTGDVVNGATVTSDDEASDDEADARVVSAPTPEDPNIDDGFYWMFAGLTRMHSFTASADFYDERRRMVRLRAGTVTERDFRLPAGQLTVEPAEINTEVKEGRTGKDTFTVTNTGSAPARLELRERRGQHAIPRPDGSSAGETEHGASVEPAGTNPVTRVEGEFSPLSLAGSDPGEAGGTRDGVTAGDSTESNGGPWLEIPDYPITIMDNTVVEHGGKIYSVGGVDGVQHVSRGFVYDPAEGSWSEIAPMPEARESAAGGFIDGKLYVHGGWGPDGNVTDTTFVYDPETDTWSSAAAGPRTGAASGHAVLDDQLYVVGGCNRLYCSLDDLRRYDPETDAWEQLADYPRLVAHQACGAIDGQLYCAGGVRIGGAVWNMTYAYDPETDSWTRKADLPIQLWGMAHSVSSDRLLVSGGITGGPPDVGQVGEPTEITNEGFTYDPRTDNWSPLPPAGDVRYRGGSACGLYRIGGSFQQTWNPTFDSEVLPTYGACDPADVPWMSLESDAITLEPGKKTKVTVEYDAGDTEPGQHEAGVWIWQDTPYLTYPVDVTMTVG